MGKAVDLCDAVADKLRETSFGTATVTRQLVPEVYKKGLNPSIIVALQGKTSVEQDRSNEFIEYRIGAGLHYPVYQESDHDLAINMAEDIQDWLSLKANRHLVTGDGTFCLVPPFEMEALFDPAQVREAGVMFFVTNFNYRFYQSRNS